MTRPVHDDGYVPIDAYAIVGDGRTVALIASDGSVDWWPCPTLDAPPLCAALVDPGRGGRFVLCPVGRYEVTVATSTGQTSSNPPTGLRKAWSRSHRP